MLRPLLFVAMPFGRKPDPTGQYDVDFDDLYGRVIKVAAEQAGVDVLRADEETYGGFIHAAMYERLLLAEIVLADLTMANPNVYYELGIRHAARPRSTILLYALASRLPFDLSPLRAVAYDLKDGRLLDDHIDTLTATLRQRIEQAKSDSDHTDSPLFLLLPGLRPPSLEPDAAESFRDRLRWVADVQQHLEVVKRSDRAVALRELAAINAQLQPYANAPVQLLFDLMFAYRAISAWDEVIHLLTALPPAISARGQVQEQLAMALNRRNQPGDRDRAVAVLDRLVAIEAPSPETYGILGRIYKDMYTEHGEAGRPMEAAAALEHAIQSYVAGFEADPRDYYPGINAITLSLQQTGAAAQARVRRLRPVVAFAVERRRRANAQSYWDVAAACELAAIEADWPAAQRAAGELCILAREAWMVETTAQNLRLIAHWLETQHHANDALAAIVAMVQRRAADLVGPAAPVTA